MEYISLFFESELVCGLQQKWWCVSYKLRLQECLHGFIYSFTKLPQLVNNRKPKLADEEEKSHGSESPWMARPSQTAGMWVIPAKITNDSANSPVDHKWLSMNNREHSSLGLNRKNSLSDLQTNK